MPPNYTNFLLYIIWLIAPLTWKRSKLIVTLNNGIRGQWSREQIYVPIYVWSIIFIKNMGQAGRWAGSEKMKKIKTGRVGAAFRSFRWGGSLQVALVAATPWDWLQAGYKKKYIKNKTQTAPWRGAIFRHLWLVDESGKLMSCPDLCGSPDY